MKVALDFSAVTMGAGVVYAENLLSALGSSQPEEEIFVLLPARGHQLSALPENFRYFRVPRSFAWPAVRVALSQLWLPIWVARHRIDVLVSPTDYTALLVNRPIVLGMHNLNPYHGPKASTIQGRLREWALRHLSRWSARKADAVFFVSESARTLMSRRLAVDSAKTFVVHYGVRPEFFDHPLTTSPSGSVPSGPYVLAVSAIRGHKDLDSLIAGFSRLVEGDGLPHRLVIAGAKVDPSYAARLKRLIDHYQLAGRVSFLGEIPHQAMPLLYREADLMVLPSWSETFGLPLIEAMASGVPAIASDIPALGEVGADAVVYYRPGDAVDLERAMRQVLTDQGLRLNMQRKGMDRAKQFSWMKAARETMELVRLVGTRHR